MSDKDVKSYRPPLLDTIEDNTKIAAFDKLYKMAFEHYVGVAETGSDDGDDCHYIYEEVMMLCLGKDIFKHYNELLA